MTLDIPISTQMGNYAIVKAKCCVYIPDPSDSIPMAIQGNK